jgi:hypothetical protein
VQRYDSTSDFVFFSYCRSIPMRKCKTEELRVCSFGWFIVAESPLVYRVRKTGWPLRSCRRQHTDTFLGGSFVRSPSIEIEINLPCRCSLRRKEETGQTPVSETRPAGERGAGGGPEPQRQSRGQGRRNALAGSAADAWRWHSESQHTRGSGSKPPLPRAGAALLHVHALT